MNYLYNQLYYPTVFSILTMSSAVQVYDFLGDECRKRCGVEYALWKQLCDLHREAASERQKLIWADVPYPCYDCTDYPAWNGNVYCQRCTDEMWLVGWH